MEDDHNDMVHHAAHLDFLDIEPSAKDKMEMRKASKRPSDWLRLICKDWAQDNEVLAETADAKFLQYKPYLKGLLSSQLLCRLSIPPTKDVDAPIVDFWGICGIHDEFDKAYIVAQVERFSSLYNIRGPSYLDEPSPSVDSALFDDHAATVAAAAAAANGGTLMPFLNDATVAAVAAAAAASDVTKGLNKKQAAEVTKAHRLAKDAEKALELERRQNQKREQRRISQERKEQKAREREAQAIRKAAERITRDAARDEKRQTKLRLRQQREHFAQEQKEAALKRAAELVASNRVPIEITRGAAAAKAAANAALSHLPVSSPSPEPEVKKQRSAIVVSTAHDLHQIVTHSKNLWAKYNAIAKEHNQKVNWITVAKELGIHVKVREKYARMHFRAEQRGFDWVKNGHWKIKDHPEIFHEPTDAEQKAKMPPPPPDTHLTVLINENNKEIGQAANPAATTMGVTDAAVAAAAAVVTAGGGTETTDHHVHTEDSTTAAAVAATLEDVESHVVI
eukprot:Nitzschia sp. Nitz4//scaffold101_size76361//6468//8470//NITZ4_005592-RA/size76361-augustus-gene-0.0-mRNA-1//1//CDS//3329532128//5996//frame0